MGGCVGPLVWGSADVRVVVCEGPWVLEPLVVKVRECEGLRVYVGVRVGFREGEFWGSVGVRVNVFEGWGMWRSMGVRVVWYQGRWVGWCICMKVGVWILNISWLKVDMSMRIQKIRLMNERLESVITCEILWKVITWNSLPFYVLF